MSATTDAPDLDAAEDWRVDPDPARPMNDTIAQDDLDVAEDDETGWDESATDESHRAEWDAVDEDRSAVSAW